jgi:hypothetical protein
MIRTEYLRKVLFQIGWGLKTHHEEYQRAYQAMRARGKNYKTCIIALARKFLRFLFAFYWKKTLSFPSGNEKASVLVLPALESAMVSPLSTA